jgi:nucleoid-associated protein YgaU
LFDKPASCSTKGEQEVTPRLIQDKDQETSGELRKKPGRATSMKAKIEAAAMAAKAEVAATEAKPEFIAQHTVVSGDSLGKIALQHYGSGSKDKWMLIYEANKEVIGDDPSLIRVGQVLQIPKLPTD